MKAEDIHGPSIEEIDDELGDQWERMVENAERDIREVRVSMRWQQPQVDIIRRAAALFGIPYQTYMKQAAFRQALADLQAVQAATGEPGQGAEKHAVPKAS